MPTSDPPAEAATQRGNQHDNSAEGKGQADAEPLALPDPARQRLEDERLTRDDLLATHEELTEPFALLGGKLAAAPLNVGGERAQALDLAGVPVDRCAGIFHDAALEGVQERRLQARECALERVEPRMIGVREGGEGEPRGREDEADAGGEPGQGARAFAPRPRAERHDAA